MPNISSLLRSAQTAQRKIAEQQDAQVAYDYGLSAKTYDDFLEYSKYLDSRRSVYSSDASKLLTIDKTINAARKAYVSNEIQRQNIDIIEGRGDNNTKYQKLVDLFYDAVDNQDFDQAQTLNLQIDNLSVKMQNEAIAAQEKSNANYANAVNSGKKAVAALEGKIKNGAEPFVTLPDGNEVLSLAYIENSVKENGQLILPDGTPDNAILAAQESAQALAQIEISKYENATTQEERDKLEEKYGPQLQNLYTELKVDFLGQKLSTQELYDALQSEKTGNPLFTVSEVATPNGISYKLDKSKIDNVEYIRNEDGSYSPINTTSRNISPYQNLETKFDNKGNVVGTNDSVQAGSGKATESASLKDRLANVGVNIIGTNSDGTVDLITPDGVTRNNATIQPDGSIRYFGQPNEYSGDTPGVYEISVFDRNIGTNDLPLQQKAGQVRAVAPDETSDFGEASKFGAKQSFASAAGNNYLDSFRGDRTLSSVLPTDLRGGGQLSMSGPTLSGPIRTGNDFSGVGGAVTSSLLQAGLFTTRNIKQEEQQKQILLQAQQEQQRLLQQAQAFDLNQTPVRQLASSGALVGQLKVAPLPAHPRITVGPAAPTPKITSVGVGGNQGGAVPQGRIVIPQKPNSTRGIPSF